MGFEPKQTKRSFEWHQHKRKRIATHRVTYYIHFTEVTNQWRKVVDDEVSCIEFRMIYIKFYFIINQMRRC